MVRKALTTALPAISEVILLISFMKLVPGAHGGFDSFGLSILHSNAIVIFNKWVGEN